MKFSEYSLLRGVMAALVLVFAAGCATNPVTGKREFSIVSEAQEIQMGTENYSPAQQASGGRYITHPSVEDYVAGIGRALVAQSDRPQLPYEFVVLNSSVPNAWAMPGGKIAINRGLLVEMDNEAQLAAVLGHEIVHAAARHGAKSMQRAMLLQVGMLGVAIAADGHQDGQWAVGAASVALGMTQQKYSRDAERESDAYGLRYMQAAGYDPQGCVQLQEAFVRLKGGQRASSFDALFGSHPPSEERVATLREMAKDFPAGGRLGEADYARAMRPLTRSVGAYRAADKAAQVVKDKRYAHATRLTEAALKTEPKEARFYGVKGDILAAQNRHRDALRAYEKAIALQEDYYHFHLMRGLSLKAQGNTTGSRAALSRSVELLPTSAAHNELGNMMLASGQRAQALKSFEQAAGADDPSGKQARVSLARLTIPETPGRYIKVSLAQNTSGQLVVRVQNASPVAVKDVAVQVAVGSGDAAHTHQVSAASLPAGHVATIPTTIDIPQVPEGQRPAISASVTRAALAE